MKILVASDAFKGTLSSKMIGSIIERCLDEHDVDVMSISDGGEGMIEALKDSVKGKSVKVPISGPLGEELEGYYIITDDRVAIIESAMACGLDLVEQGNRNPMLTSTFGLGLIIRDALLKGAKHIIIGIGGTGTNDAGIGMLEALGVEFFAEERMLTHVTGKDLIHIKKVSHEKLDDLIADVTIEVACDVNNPLLGPKGATFTFGPQKGATPDICQQLEAGMTSYVEAVSRKNLSQVPGAGAAGGLGFCFLSFFDATLKPGIDLVLDTLKFDQCLNQYDVVITGEGKIDGQTIHGKVPKGVLERAKNLDVKTIAVCGLCEGEPMDFEAVFSVVPEVASIDQSLMTPELCFEQLIQNKVKPWLMTKLT